MSEYGIRRKGGILHAALMMAALGGMPNPYGSIQRERPKCKPKHRPMAKMAAQSRKRNRR